MQLILLMTSISIALIASLVITPTVNFVRGASTDPYSFPVGSSPYGIPFKDWTAKWWTWYQSVPKLNNPNFQNVSGYTPVECSYLQDPANPAIFLPYVGVERGSSTTANCNIPYGKAVLILVDGGEADYSDPTVQPKTQDTLVNQVTKSNVYPNPFGITFDGHQLALTNDEALKVQSDLFNFTLPPKNLSGEAAGPDKGIGQGWYLFLKPLSPGVHIVHYTTGYRDSKSDPTIPPGQGNDAPYIQDVTYRLVVK
jgi:hypothetical protein